MSLTLRESAYAKVNLCLLLGPGRPDGRHELVTVFDSLRLHDELVVGVGAGSADSVVCEGVPGRNLVSDALDGLRAAGWEAPWLSVEIWKRIPVAAGMGGGSADAAAMLRCARRVSSVSDAVLGAVAVRLGADVPAQLTPGVSLGTGAGEVVTPVPGGLAPYGVLVLPAAFTLSTADVYREADRLGLGRPADELGRAAERLSACLGPRGDVPAELCVNDLQDAALSLAPEIGRGLEAARSAGADRALVCGSGPTVIGLYAGVDGVARARAAASELGWEGAVGTGPVRPSQWATRA